MVLDGPSVALDPSVVDVDVAHFERLVADGRPAALEQVAGLYKGNLLAGLTLAERPFDEWLTSERERLHELAIQGQQDQPNEAGTYTSRAARGPASAQARLLPGWLDSEGYDVLLTFEPGDTEVGLRVRQIVLDPSTGGWPTAPRRCSTPPTRPSTWSRGPASTGPRRGGDDRPLRRLPLAYQGAGRPLTSTQSSGWPLGDPRPAPAPDRRARPGARPRAEPVRDARPDRGGVPAFHQRVREAFIRMASRTPSITSSSTPGSPPPPSPP